MTSLVEGITLTRKPLTYLFKIFHLHIVLVCVPLWPLQNSSHQICLCKFSHLILRKIILLVFFLKVFPSVNFYAPFVMVNVLIFFLVISPKYENSRLLRFYGYIQFKYAIMWKFHKKKFSVKVYTNIITLVNHLPHYISL